MYARRISDETCGNYFTCGSYRLVCCRDVVKRGGEALQGNHYLYVRMIALRSEFGNRANLNFQHIESKHKNAEDI